MKTRTIIFAALAIVAAIITEVTMANANEVDGGIPKPPVKYGPPKPQTYGRGRGANRNNQDQEPASQPWWSSLSAQTLTNNSYLQPTGSNTPMVPIVPPAGGGGYNLPKPPGSPGGPAITPKPKPKWWSNLTTKVRDRLNQLGTPSNLGNTYPMTVTDGNAPNPAVFPTGSVLSGDGSNIGETINPAIYPTGTFLTGDGLVNTGYPIFPVLESLAQGGGGFGTNYGANWKRGRGGGGGGGGGGYNPTDYLPAFYLGLNSWNYGE